MKQLLLIVCVLFCFSSVNTLKAQETFKWKEMAAFHTTAMKAFHSAEIHKLQPAKDSAGVIVQKAKLWQVAAVPKDCDATAIQPMLQTLVAECQAIKDAADAQKPDAELQSLVMKAHETFHAIGAKCKQD